jgi:hypothetical protein
LRRLATKRGLLPSTPIDELEGVLNPDVAGGHDDGVVHKEGKASDGFRVGAMDTRADYGLSEENTQGEGDTEMMGLEDIAPEALAVEFDWLRSSDPQTSRHAPRQPPDEVPPTARLLGEIGAEQ